MEHLRKGINVKLASNEDILKKHGAKANYISSKKFNRNLFAINRIKEKLILNRPIYVGMSILELSKLLMYDFHYNYILKKYDKKNVCLMFTDTDSLLYEMKTEDAYKDLYEKKDQKYFDTSDYPIKSKHYSEENKTEIVKMKDEAARVPVKEFVGLRSKTYSYYFGDECIKNVKALLKGLSKIRCHLMITLMSCLTLRKRHIP